MNNPGFRIPPSEMSLWTLHGCISATFRSQETFRMTDYASEMILNHCVQHPSPYMRRNSVGQTSWTWSDRCFPVKANAEAHNRTRRSSMSSPRVFNSRRKVYTPCLRCWFYGTSILLILGCVAISNAAPTTLSLAESSETIPSTTEYKKWSFWTIISVPGVMAMVYSLKILLNSKGDDYSSSDDEPFMVDIDEEELVNGPNGWPNPEPPGFADTPPSRLELWKLRDRIEATFDSGLAHYSAEIFLRHCYEGIIPIPRSGPRAFRRYSVGQSRWIWTNQCYPAGDRRFYKPILRRTKSEGYEVISPRNMRCHRCRIYLAVALLLLFVVTADTAPLRDGIIRGVTQSAETNERVLRYFADVRRNSGRTQQQMEEWEKRTRKLLAEKMEATSPAVTLGSIFRTPSPSAATTRVPRTHYFRQNLYLLNNTMPNRANTVQQSVLTLDNRLNDLFNRTQQPTKVKNESDGFRHYRRQVYHCSTLNPVFVRVPEMIPVCTETFLNPAPWKKGNVTLYSRVTQPIPVEEAYICANRREYHSYYTDILGNPFDTPQINVSTIDPEECREWRHSEYCPRGRLVHQAGKLYTTTNPLDPPIVFPGRIEGIFTGRKEAESNNCLVEQIALFVYSHDLSLYSPTHDVRHCKYSNKHCTLEHHHGKMTLVWEADFTKPCHVERTGIISGTYNANHFWSTDHSLTLTFEDRPMSRDSDCHGNWLKMDIQGQAILQIEYQAMQRSIRSKRETATTEELAAELTAEEFKTHEKMLNLLRMLCPTLTSVRPDATLTARRIMKTPAVMGKWRSPTLLEVFQCAAVNMKDIHLRESKECTLDTPVFQRMAKLGFVGTYLDTFFSILMRTSPKADCRLHDRQYLDAIDGVYEYDNHMNRGRLIPESALVHYAYAEPSTGLDPEDFHDLVLTRDVETFQQAFGSTSVQEMERVNDWVNQAELHQDEYAKSIGAQRHTISGTMDAIITGEVAWIHDLWLNLCGVFITCLAVYHFVRCFLEVTTCLPMKTGGRILRAVFSFLWAVISLVARGIYLTVRFLVRRCRGYERIRTEEAAATSPTPVMEEIGEEDYQNSPYQAPVLSPTRPIPIRSKPLPPLPMHKPLIGFFRPQADRTVVLQVETTQPEPSTSASSAPGTRIEPVYEETPCYDTIYGESGQKVPRTKLGDRMNAQWDRLFRQAAQEIEMSGVVNSDQRSVESTVL